MCRCRIAWLLLLATSLFAQSVDSTNSKPISFPRFEFVSTVYHHLPIRDLTDLNLLYSGFYFINNQWHLRGARADEVGWYLEDEMVVDPLNYSSNLYLIPEALQSLEVLPDVVPARYSVGNAGILRARLRTGGSSHRFRVNARTDRVFPQEKEFLGTYSYRDQIVSAVAEGPLWGASRYFVALEGKNIGDTQKRFSRGFSFYDLVDSTPRPGPPDTVAEVHYPDGFTPGNRARRFALNTAVDLKTGPLSLRLISVFSHLIQYHDNAPMFHVLNPRQQYVKHHQFYFSAYFTHQFHRNGSYEIGFHFHQKYEELNDDYFGNDWRAWKDSLKVAQHTGGKVQYPGRWSPGYDYHFCGFPFTREGTIKNNFQKSLQEGVGFRFALKWKPGKGHLLRAGAGWKGYRMRFFEIDPVVMVLVERFGGEDQVPPEFWWEFMGNSYGYDRFGQKLDEGLDAARKPKFIHLFAEDRWEFGPTSVFAGFNLSRFDTDDRGLKNPANPEFDPEESRIAPEEWKKRHAPFLGNVRFNLNYRFSRQWEVSAGFGTYTQPPRLSLLYFSEYRMYRQITGTWYYQQNQYGFDLDPLRTEKYHLMIHGKAGGGLVRWSADLFYRKTKNQIFLKLQKVEPQAPVTNYPRFANGDRSLSKGVEFNFALQRFHHLLMEGNYTFLHSTGTASDEKEYLKHKFLHEKPSHEFTNLDYGIRHRAVVVLDYRFFNEAPLSFLQQSGVGIIFKMNSGHPYTQLEYVNQPLPPYGVGVNYMLGEFRKEIEPHNSSFTPWVYTVDFSLDKTFRIASRFQLKLFLQIYNLFNRKNVLNVYEATGSPTKDGFINNPAEYENFYYVQKYGEKFLEMYRAINIANGQAYWVILGKQIYDHPRQILLGVGVEF